MLIIAGHLHVEPVERARILDDHVKVAAAALAAPGCLDFAATPDTSDPGRIRVYECWESEEQLLAFRGDGPSNEQQHDIIDADVKRYVISSVEEP